MYCMYVQDKHMITSICSCGLGLCSAFWFSVISRISLTLCFLIYGVRGSHNSPLLNRDGSAFRPCPSFTNYIIVQSTGSEFFRFGIRCCHGNKLKSIDFLCDAGVHCAVTCNNKSYVHGGAESKTPRHSIWPRLCLIRYS